MAERLNGDVTALPDLSHSHVGRGPVRDPRRDADSGAYGSY